MKAHGWRSVGFSSQRLIDHERCCIGKIRFQYRLHVVWQRYFFQGLRHQLDPPIPGRNIHLEGRVTHPKPGMSSLHAVRLWPTESLDEKFAQALFGLLEFAMRIHWPEDVVGRYASIECTHQPAETVFADGCINLVFGNHHLKYRNVQRRVQGRRTFLSRTLAVLAVSVLPTGCAQTRTKRAKPMGPQAVLRLPPRPGNPRNSEGDFIRLRDGTIQFIYTHFDGEQGRDDSPAHLAGRRSTDNGRTWSDVDEVVMPLPGGINIMSVSLLRLQSGGVAMLYLHKRAPGVCVPCITFSDDETESWSLPASIATDSQAYHVVNNNRMIQLQDGRIVVPVAQPRFANGAFTPCQSGCLLSDDEGKSWHWGRTMLPAPIGSTTGLQEPVVVELKDSRLMMLCRTDLGCQYRSWSSDRGETWTLAEPTDITSPISPASVARVPSTNDLLMIWNDHRSIDESRRGKRTPMSAAISRDEGLTWSPSKTLFEDPRGWYCYTAIEFVENALLLGHCAGTRTEVKFTGLDTTQITRLDVSWLYE